MRRAFQAGIILSLLATTALSARAQEGLPPPPPPSGIEAPTIPSSPTAPVAPTLEAPLVAPTVKKTGPEKGWVDRLRDKVEDIKEMVGLEKKPAKKTTTPPPADFDMPTPTPMPENAAPVQDAPSLPSAPAPMVNPIGEPNFPSAPEAIPSTPPVPPLPSAQPALPEAPAVAPVTPSPAEPLKMKSAREGFETMLGHPITEEESELLSQEMRKEIMKRDLSKPESTSYDAVKTLVAEKYALIKEGKITKESVVAPNFGELSGEISPPLKAEKVPETATAPIADKPEELPVSSSEIQSEKLPAPNAEMDATKETPRASREVTNGAAEIKPNEVEEVDIAPVEARDEQVERDNMSAGNSLTPELLRKDFKTQVLPGSIYRKEYQSRNAHLPKVVYPEEYTGMLFASVARGDLNAIRSLLDRGVDINGYNSIGDTPLTHAALNGRADSMRVLLGRGANPNQPSKHGLLPLQISAERGRADMVEALLAMGAESSANYRSPATPLRAGVTQGYASVYHAFNSYQNPNIIREEERSKALEKIAQGGAGPRKILSRGTGESQEIIPPERGPRQPGTSMDFAEIERGLLFQEFKRKTAQDPTYPSSYRPTPPQLALTTENGGAQISPLETPARNALGFQPPIEQTRDSGAPQAAPSVPGIRPAETMQSPQARAMQPPVNGAPQPLPPQATPQPPLSAQMAMGSPPPTAPTPPGFTPPDMQRTMVAVPPPAPAPHPQSMLGAPAPRVVYQKGPGAIPPMPAPQPKGMQQPPAPMITYQAQPGSPPPLPPQPLPGPTTPAFVKNEAKAPAPLPPIAPPPPPSSVTQAPLPPVHAPMSIPRASETPNNEPKTYILPWDGVSEKPAPAPVETKPASAAAISAPPPPPPAPAVAAPPPPPPAMALPPAKPIIVPTPPRPTPSLSGRVSTWDGSRMKLTPAPGGVGDAPVVSQDNDETKSTVSYDKSAPQEVIISPEPVPNMPSPPPPPRRELVVPEVKPAPVDKPLPSTPSAVKDIEKGAVPPPSFFELPPPGGAIPRADINYAPVLRAPSEATALPQEPKEVPIR